MPCQIRGYTVLKDDFFTIVINSRLSTEMQKEAYKHEMDHIQNGDFEKRCPANLIEVNAHGRSLK